eukprot:4892680-Amphidinium_carterae.3
MITADSGISIAHVKSSVFTDEMFCLYDTGANCMVLPSNKKFKGTAIRCTLPGETVVVGHVIQLLSLKEEVMVKVVALKGAAPIMPMTIVVDMAGWKVETINSTPAHLVAVDKTGKRRPMTRHDGLRYLSHEDFVDCMTNVYKKVDVLGQVTKDSLVSFLAKLRSTTKGSLMSLAETEENQATSPSGAHAEGEWKSEGAFLDEQQKAYTRNVRMVLEEGWKGI